MRLTAAQRRFHRQEMARCFNEAWEYLEKSDRTAEDDRKLLHLVHSARRHAALIGSPRNLAVGDWQISRAYAALHEPRLALAYATSCLETCQRHELSDILCTAYEAMARAYQAADDPKSARSYVAKALAALRSADLDPDDRKVYLSQIGETRKLIPGPTRG